MPALKTPHGHTNGKPQPGLTNLRPFFLTFSPYFSPKVWPRCPRSKVPLWGQWTMQQILAHKIWSLPSCTVPERTYQNRATSPLHIADSFMMQTASLNGLMIHPRKINFFNKGRILVCFCHNRVNKVKRGIHRNITLVLLWIWSSTNRAFDICKIHGQTAFPGAGLLWLPCPLQHIRRQQFCFLFLAFTLLLLIRCLRQLKASFWTVFKTWVIINWYKIYGGWSKFLFLQMAILRA